MAEESPACPFCGFRADTEYAMLYHMESLHPEGKSPFMVEEGASGSGTGTGEEEEGEPTYAACPVDGCGEIVIVSELNYHIDLHGLEEEDEEPAADTENGGQAYEVNDKYHSPYGEQEKSRPSGGSSRGKQVDSKNRQTGSIQKWKQLLAIPSSVKGHRTGPANAEGQRKRLGKSELGRYAHEDKMPDWLVRLLRSEGQVICGGIIPVIAQLLQQSPTTSYAYLCHPAVDHISKLKREGGFCGYRNIQMLSSYIVGARAVGAAHFDGHLPSIFQIQDYVENAWDQGINTQGRIETGGIKGTRKYIGTPEAQAMFLSLDIPCEAQGFKDPKPGAAEAKLMLHVQDYFASGSFDPSDKVRRTSLPPIYFQHRGHSMTIVGFEKRKNGTTELLVFDPMFHDSSSITKYLGHRFHHKSPDNALKLYRRGAKYLRRYHEFELLALSSRLPALTSDDEDNHEGFDDEDG